MKREERIGKVNQIWNLWRYLGPKWLAYRLGYAIRLRAGLLRRRLPVADWSEQPLKDILEVPALAEPDSYLSYRRSEAPAFFFSPSERMEYLTLFAGWDAEPVAPVLLSDELAQGVLRYFAQTAAQVGFPPDWHKNPFTGLSLPADRHWSQITDFGHGDIKIIWEPNRFGFTYALVRAYWRTGDERYAELFWRLTEDWQTQNPPQRGPNWKCGQEISFRVMAWCFGLYGFLDAPATTAERVTALSQMLAVSGRRIEANLSYALSQHNNHGISEGMGLWTIGQLFPEFRSAAKWRGKGRQVLEALGRDLIYDDGAFSQHSANYHRLMLHDYLWALRLGDLHGHPFSTELKDRIKTAGDFLFQIQDSESGWVPNYGANDGALILSLNNCDYQDCRPVIQATHYYSTGARCFDGGPWDEDLLWLFGPRALKSPMAVPQRADLQAKFGGCYTLRSSSSFAFVRCASFRHRPGHADMLHMDLWWRGQNVALDAGTYSYNAPPPWDGSLGRTSYHNTVTVDGLNQTDRVSRFLSFPWPQSQARCAQHSAEGHLAYWEGEHDSYQRLESPVSHRRGILRLGDAWWLVLDTLSSAEQHEYRLHWLLPDAPYEWDQNTGRLILQTAIAPYYVQTAALSSVGAYSLARGDKNSPRGWRAPFYFHREPALSVDLVAQASSMSFWTLFGPEQCDVVVNERTLRLEAEHWHGAVQLQAKLDEEQSLLAWVSLHGAIQDRLEVQQCTFS